jgi:hypothetical protein
MVSEAVRNSPSFRASNSLAEAEPGSRMKDNAPSKGRKGKINILLSSRRAQPVWSENGALRPAFLIGPVFLIGTAAPHRNGGAAHGELFLDAAGNARASLPARLLNAL